MRCLTEQLGKGSRCATQYGSCAPLDSAWSTVPNRAVDIDDRVSHCLLLGGSQRLMYANAGTD
jgi:hypothetical protein